MRIWKDRASIYEEGEKRSMEVDDNQEFSYGHSKLEMPIKYLSGVLRYTVVFTQQVSVGT